MLHTHSINSLLRMLGRPPVHLPPQLLPEGGAAATTAAGAATAGGCPLQPMPKASAAAKAAALGRMAAVLTTLPRSAASGEQLLWSPCGVAVSAPAAELSLVTPPAPPSPSDHGCLLRGLSGCHLDAIARLGSGAAVTATAAPLLTEGPSPLTSSKGFGEEGLLPPLPTPAKQQELDSTTHWAATQQTLSHLAHATGPDNFDGLMAILGL